MSLQLNHDNSKLSCNCGAVTIPMEEWNRMTEHRQLAMRQQANRCPSCKQKE